MAMTIAMALLTGYREDLERKLIAGNAAVLAYPLTPGEAGSEVEVENLLAVEGVEVVSRIAYGQGTLSVPGHEGESVTLRGADAGRDSLAGVGSDLSTDDEGVAGAVLGKELATALEVGEGDRLRLTALGFEEGRPKFAYRSLRVTGTFRSGFAEFDRHWVVVGRSLVEGVSGGSGSASLFEVVVEDPSEASQIAERVGEVLGPDFLVTDWRQMNRELFSALRLQQLLLFFLLGLIVVVSTFNVASSLMVLVRERMREIGVLKALGMESHRLAQVFVFYGLVLGTAGVSLGLALGASICWVLTRFELIRFDPEVAEIYFVSSVPFRVALVDTVAIAIFSLLVTGLACIPPARRAARVAAASALRYE
jgi:lipoprotein-releasing system permease protein